MVKKEKKEEGMLGKLLAESLLYPPEEIIEEVLEREVTKFSNGAHISIPSKHIGKTARIIIKRKGDTKKK